MPNIASHSEPTAEYIPKGFKLSTDEDGNTFDIRPSYINLVERNLYREVPGEDPRKHMERFADYCSSIPTSKGVTQDKIKEVLFLFSLTDNAREWLTDLDREAAGITDWTTLALAFYKKYFPPQRTNALRAQITNFKQTGSENLFEAWCRFKKAVRSVPHHGFQQWFDRLEMQSPESQQTVHMLKKDDTNLCERCGEPGHVAIDCFADREQVFSFQQYRQGYSSGYIHPNLRWSSQNILNPTPPPQQQAYVPPHKQGYQKPPQYSIPQQGSSSSGGISEVGELKSMIQALATQVSRSDQATNATIKLLESQIAQVAANQSTRQPGQLPSQSEKRKETLNMITLRSGLTYSDTDVAGTDVSSTNSKVVAADNAPYPGRLKRVKKTEPEFARFGELVRGLNVSVPFIELLKKVPSYLKFMREVLTRKRTINDVETVALTEGCSAHLQNRTPPKLADPGSFSIPCHIGVQLIDNELCDLGASVSVLPLSLAKRLGFTKFHCTNMTVQMADRTLSRPLGVLQDIPVEIGRFLIPVDFVVLDIPEDNHTPIILGRPFLHTAQAVIDVGMRTLTFNVGGEELVFAKPATHRGSMRVLECHAIPAIGIDTPPMIESLSMPIVDIKSPRVATLPVTLTPPPRNESDKEDSAIIVTCTRPGWGALALDQGEVSSTVGMGKDDGGNMTRILAEEIKLGHSSESGTYVWRRKLEVTAAEGNSVSQRPSKGLKDLIEL
ncbi:uncharacterized protein LOC141649469 [Silene latifolia]|uniref:uncharacterized protein LOC141649469 n=1 Tax=Silene latifolia TaxID=37657 RepID=UPI003D770377